MFTEEDLQERSNESLLKIYASYFSEQSHKLSKNREEECQGLRMVRQEILRRMDK